MLKNKLRKLRIENKLTQTELAELIGVTRAAVANYERGKNPSIDVLKKLCEVFNVSLDYLDDNKKTALKAVEMTDIQGVEFFLSGRKLNEKELKQWIDYLHFLSMRAV
jgi:transcriptional regulator with XRE-family HTH domain